MPSVFISAYLYLPSSAILPPTSLNSTSSRSLSNTFTPFTLAAASLIDRKTFHCSATSGSKSRQQSALDKPLSNGKRFWSFGRLVFIYRSGLSNLWATGDSTITEFMIKCINMFYAKLRLILSWKFGIEQVHQGKSSTVKRLWFFHDL